MNILETIVCEQAKQDHKGHKPWKYVHWINDVNAIFVMKAGPPVNSYERVKDVFEEKLGSLYIEERSKYGRYT